MSKLIQNKRHVSRHVSIQRSKLAGHFYNCDIGCTYRHLQRRFTRGHRVELTAWRNLIKIYIGSVCGTHTLPASPENGECG